ncbi:bifunctional 2-aminoadipate transaminase/aromatic-amino-acid:2-oxoglutarate transaminase [Saccharomycopsis crataegensis]|uniref:aromatic-amino-acid transaminase n=1 Tax=Saccharomycopsis crataegensis TaxID=43959 RepID=A0AAV5QVV4_9ASCO|nr:bifunctional 2-aminoadipate transaminase/aromatic-amino-acid:2-oxoglutarate transaminase [Saccharomycopsis crataegensis]
MTVDSSLPLSKDLDYHLSAEALRRKESPLKGAFKYYGKPDLVFLGGGLPQPTYFPWNKITTESPAPPFENGIGYKPQDASEMTISEITKHTPSHLEGIDIPLSRSLQYGNTNGQPELIKFLKEHTTMVHPMQYQDWDLIVNTGNTQGWNDLLRNFCDKGDTILTEEYTFASSLEAANAQAITTFPVKMDSFGIIPSQLDAVLTNWIGKKPKLLYTIPTGQNPTGSSLSNERRQEIYKIACKHDILIVEDEPYYFLQMEEYTKDVNARSGKSIHNHEEFVKAMVKSFLSLDTEGRVLRLDSCSKTLAPGTRVGWITAKASFIERFTRIQEVSSQNCSGFSQSIVGGTLNRWGQTGYLDWLIKLRAEYTHKRDVTVDSIYKHFPTELMEFVPPVAGMFFAFHIDATKHPKFESEFKGDVLAVEKAIYERAAEYGSYMIPGSWFKTVGQTEPPQQVAPEKQTHLFFRGTYAATPLDEIIVGIERFGKAIKDEFGIKN